MVHLKDFDSFDTVGFFKDKILVTRKCRDWTDDKTGIHLGTKVTVAIDKDNTVYDLKDGEEDVDNEYEQILIKVKNDVKFPKNTPVVMVNAVAKIYGDFAEKLSVTAEDMKLAQQSKSVPPTRMVLNKEV